MKRWQVYAKKSIISMLTDFCEVHPFHPSFSIYVIDFQLVNNDTPFFETHLIADSPPSVNPYSADLVTVDRIKNSLQYWQSQQWY